MKSSIMKSYGRSISLFLVMNYVIVVNATSANVISNLSGVCAINKNDYHYLCRDVIGTFPNIGYDRTFYDSLKCEKCILKNFTINTFPYTNYLTAINISESDIEHLGPSAFAKLTRCKIIDLSYNRLTHLPNNLGGDVDLNVDTLCLEYNLILELYEDNFRETPHLLSLSINNNFIRKIHYDSFKNLKNLLYLEMENNEICSLPLGVFKDLSNLKELNLANNKLTNLPLGTFSGLKSLQDLKLNDNSLKHFKGTELLPLHRISRLELKGNKIFHFDAANVYFDAPTLRQIVLEGNFFTCAMLIETVQVFKSKGIDIETENGRYNVTNIDGIACVEDFRSDMSTKDFEEIVLKESRENLNQC